MTNFKSKPMQDLKDAILLTNELIVNQADSRPLTQLYVATAVAGAKETGLVKYWNGLPSFVSHDKATRLVTKLAQKYLGSMWYLDHFIRHNGLKNAQYIVKAQALELELDESFDFFEFTVEEHLLDPQLHAKWYECDERSRPVLESVLLHRDVA